MLLQSSLQLPPPPSHGTPLAPNPAFSSLAEESNKKHPFPCPTSYRTALTYYLDITNPPRTNVLYELAQYASEPSEQEHLRKMASSSGEGKVSLPHCPLRSPPPQPCAVLIPYPQPPHQLLSKWRGPSFSQVHWANASLPRFHPAFCPPQELYLSWVVEARRHILAILQDYPSLRPPIDHLCELLPRLQARYYSIASSSKVGRGLTHL